MTTITPNEEEFCQKIHTVYYVNGKPNTLGISTTTSGKCPHCQKRHIFKVFNEKKCREQDGWLIETYDCKCPSCKENFDLEIEWEI